MIILQLQYDFAVVYIIYKFLINVLLYISTEEKSFDYHLYLTAGAIRDHVTVPLNKFIKQQWFCLIYHIDQKCSFLVHKSIATKEMSCQGKHVHQIPVSGHPYMPKNIL